jgi:hypothetical protein
MANWAVGVDVGKRSDPTGLCIAEIVRPSGHPGPDDAQRRVSGCVPDYGTFFVVREIGRLPLGTRHTVGAYKIAEVLHNLRVADPTSDIRFLLDVTGVGEGVADLIEGYVPSTVKMTRCWFTSAERLDKQGREWRVGKPWMVSRLTSLLETGRVRLPTHPRRRLSWRNCATSSSKSPLPQSRGRSASRSTRRPGNGPRAQQLQDHTPRPAYASISPGLRPEEQPVKFMGYVGVAGRGPAPAALGPRAIWTGTSEVTSILGCADTLGANATRLPSASPHRTHTVIGAIGFLRNGARGSGQAVFRPGTSTNSSSKTRST